MKMNDERVIAAEQGVVWAALLDAEVLKACVPGCTEMTGSADKGFEATVVQKVGPVKATFKGAVTLSEMDEPNSLTLTGEGKGGDADLWEVRDQEGTVLGDRVLAHPHETEQPFTRSVSGVAIPGDVAEVVIAARDSVSGFCGDSFTLEVPHP